MNEQPILAFGKFTAPERAKLELAAKEAASRLEVVEDMTATTDLSQVSGLLLDVRSGGVAQIALRARASVDGSSLPAIALAHELGDLAFGEAYGWGADDVVSLQDTWALTVRLRNLRAQAKPATVQARGTVIIAESDRSRRIVVARVLRNAGYAVTFASEVKELLRCTDSSPVVLIVADVAISQELPELIALSRSGQSQPAWVLSCAPREQRQYREMLHEIERISLADSYAPPDNVLYVANELARGGSLGDKRQSARLLYNTMVAYRPAGRDQDDFGFSYNISEGGLYVRTVAPPGEELAWLELVPPRSELRVRLVCRVRWRVGFASGTVATVPPGFGAEIIDGARIDLEAWRSGYEAFRRDVG
jgi:hypothetical protein